MLYEPFPEKQYDLIYADPPWSYRDKSLHRGGAERHYSCMKIRDICALPVADIATKDSILLIWATYPQLPAAFEVIDAWGFQYKTVAFTWIKTTKNGSIFTGMGHYTRANPEIVLLERRGKGVKRMRKDIKNVHFHERLDHSRKPDLFRDLIESLFGNTSRVELFARERFPGWDAWGDEVQIAQSPARCKGIEGTKYQEQGSNASQAANMEALKSFRREVRSIHYGKQGTGQC